ncbi:hypothetical protein [Halomonas rhizosphaerae]|uniref:Chemotaxis methyl-accepting receptor HlyB-like 4HB MCP domain-containing protein n=1 Tax=Halomonas rhizosphaerae TaxID=3043296 RepID=A0ABT6V1J8_9GAMM|nr:hypothetical protein [Halomonas rhizosphaerae]MDI5891806.1 hypothetical protein [Halomonas rhizosphaerae]
MKSHWFTLSIAIFTILVTLAALYQQLTSVRLAEYPLERDMFEFDVRTEKLQQQIEKLVQKSVAELPLEASASVVEVRLKKIDERIEAVSDQTLALRQAINPVKPDDILTIARLTDEVKSLRVDFEQLGTTLSAQQQGFQESILRELKSSNDSTRLVLAVLIPLVLNFLYTLWKDLRSEKKEKAMNDSTTKGVN